MFRKFVEFIFAKQFLTCSFKKKEVLCESVESDLSICKFASRGKIVYIRIFPHFAEAEII